MRPVYQAEPYPKNDDPTPQIAGHTVILGGKGEVVTTVGDLMDICVQYKIAPHKMVVAGGHARWESLETPEQAAERAERWVAHKKWLKESAYKQYVRLKEQFETPIDME